EDAALRPFATPEEGPEEAIKIIGPSAQRRRSIERDPAGDIVYRIFNEGGEFAGAAPVHLKEIGLTIGFAAAQHYRIGASDPLSARAGIRARATLRRKRWAPEVHATVELHATADSFIVTARLTANEGDEEIMARIWDEKIPRDLM